MLGPDSSAVTMEVGDRISASAIRAILKRRRCKATRLFEAAAESFRWIARIPVVLEQLKTLKGSFKLTAEPCPNSYPNLFQKM